MAAAPVPVGVDIEHMERITLPVLKRVLPPSRYQALTERPETDFPERERWARAWTAVEAVVKATGRGFTFETQKEEAFFEGWRIESFTEGNGYVISCAVREPFWIRRIRAEVP